jgi:cytochrome b pre-mRNA-processing protein 3
MVLSLFRKKAATEPVFVVYRAIVAQSRQPHFYAEWGVPDTVTGRFDMISLHLALLFRRLRAETGPAKVFSQAVFDLFFKDMDRSLREMGAGDLAVPKKIKKMGNLFFGLLASLNEALEGGDVEAVAVVLRRNIYDQAADAPARHLAEYLIAESAVLAAQPAEEIIAGHIVMGEAA